MEKMAAPADPVTVAPWPLFGADTSMAFSFPPDLPPVPFPQDLALLSYIAPPHLDYYYSALYGLPSQSSGQDCGTGDGLYGAAYIRKRNERERQRVRCVNEGYAKLRRHLPQEYMEKRLSKVQTLRAAIRYICHLQEALRRGGETADTRLSCDLCDRLKR